MWLTLGSNNSGTGDAVDLSFIESLTNCTNLRILGLDDNGFGGILPDSFTSLWAQLRYLVAGRNQFVGNIQAGISKYVNLIELGLEQNVVINMNLISLTLHFQLNTYFKIFFEIYLH